jgi:phage gp36-like protein
MAYATSEDLAARLAGETLVLLADDDGDGAADATVTSAALEDASAEIDHALRGRYATPVTEPPEIMRRWCVDLAVARLFIRKREAMSSEYADAAALARKALAAIADGATGLAGAKPWAGDMASENTRRERPAAGRHDDCDLRLF